MALTNTQSAEMAEGFRRYPIDSMGKFRFMHGLVTQGAAAGDDGSTVEFGFLPQGRVRVLLPFCWYKASALGAARVLKIGHRQYRSKYLAADTDTGTEAPVIAEDDDAFISGIDVSAATRAAFTGAAATFPLKYDFFSYGGITLFGTVTGGTIPAAATIELMMAYVYE
jgi:hypothetical protein